MRDEPNVGLRCLVAHALDTTKGCWFILTAGRWSWKLKSAKECVITHLPNGLAPKMDGAQVGNRCLANVAGWLHQWVGGYVVLWRSFRVQAEAKQIQVQILVVVAIIQMGPLKTGVEKAFMWTAVGHELVDLCVQGCSPYAGFAPSFERE